MPIDERPITGAAVASVPGATVSSVGFFPGILPVAGAFSSARMKGSERCTDPACGLAMSPPPMEVFTTLDEVIMADTGGRDEGEGGVPEESLASAGKAGVGDGKLTVNISARAIKLP